MSGTRPNFPKRTFEPYAVNQWGRINPRKLWKISNRDYSGFSSHIILRNRTQYYETMNRAAAQRMVGVGRRVKENSKLGYQS